MNSFLNQGKNPRTSLKLLLKGPFNLRNRPMEWNDYSYGIVNHLLGRSIFLEIVIPMGMSNPIHKEIVIPLKKE